MHYKTVYIFFKTSFLDSLDELQSSTTRFSRRHTDTKNLYRQNAPERAMRLFVNCNIAICMTANPLMSALTLFKGCKVKHANPILNAWTGMWDKGCDHMTHQLSVCGMRVVPLKPVIRMGRPLYINRINMVGSHVYSLRQCMCH